MVMLTFRASGRWRGRSTRVHLKGPTFPLLNLPDYETLTLGNARICLSELKDSSRRLLVGSGRYGPVHNLGLGVASRPSHHLLYREEERLYPAAQRRGAAAHPGFVADDARRSSGTGVITFVHPRPKSVGIVHRANSVEAGTRMGRV
jgi:hypothetical protein